jgi:hypothetical protein
MTSEMFCDGTKVIRECRSKLNVVRASRTVEVARAAEGSLTEGFEVLDSCHKSVCPVKRVWLSTVKVARLSRTDSAVLRVAWSGDC